MEQSREEKLSEMREWLTLDMREGISKVILGELAEYSNKYLAPNDFEAFLSEKGVNVIDVEHDSNGWEMDNWHTYKIRGKKFTIFGRGWYGGTSFELAEDEDIEEEEPEENIEDIKDWI